MQFGSILFRTELCALCVVSTPPCPASRLAGKRCSMQLASVIGVRSSQQVALDLVMHAELDVVHV